MTPYKKILFTLFSLLAFAVLFCPVLGQAAAPDAFENDNTPTEANLIEPHLTEPHGPPQRHNFFAFGDEDWVKFYATTEWPYGIWVTGLAPRCDAVLEVYDSDGTTLLASADAFYGPENEYINWFDAPHEGFFFVRVRNYNRSAYGERTGYDLEVTGGQSFYMPMGTVTGFVTDKQTGAPLPDVRIETDFSKIATAVTDQDGLYEIAEYEGTVTLSTWHPNYETHTQTIGVDGFAKQVVNVALDPAVPPVFNLKADGKTGTVTVASIADTPLSIALDAGNRQGENADWWLLALDGQTLYYLDLISLSWQPWLPAGMPAFFQGPVFDIPDIEISLFPGFPAATNQVTVLFGVDMKPNGTLDPDRFYWGLVQALTGTP